MQVTSSELNQSNTNLTKFWPWLLGITLAWPGIQLLIFAFRFERLPMEMLIQSLYFAPLGFLSGILIIYFVRRAKNRGQQACAIMGYLIASPIAVMSSLLSGLLLPPIIGTVIYGMVPLTIGVVVGYAIGKLFPTN